MRRLYVQIYLTIIASLVLVVIVSGIIWQTVSSDRIYHNAFDIAGKLVIGSLPPADAPKLQQQRSLRKLSEELNIDLALYDQNRKLVAAWGTPLPKLEKSRLKSGRVHRSGRSSWQISLPDNRWLVASVKSVRSRMFFAPIIYLGTIAIIIGLCAFPLVRRLTGRLERLQRAVERVGSGDFSARVAIEGSDEIAQLATSFNKSTEKIEKLLAAHRQLLANASHELRTPLSRIRLGIDLYKGEKDASRKRALEQDIGELDQLIDEILLMSRLDANRQDEPWQRLDLLAIAAEECAHYDDCTIEGRSLFINGDLRLIQRLLRNLLANAAHHGKPPIELRLQANGNLAIIEVFDHGTGIPSAEREKVFAPFYRLAGSGDTRGAGLGLALVEQICQAHGGKVELIDDAGLFGVRVTLPAAE